MSSRVTHIIWDWNGTLIDDFEVILSATNVACAEVLGRPITGAEYRAHFTRPVERFYESLLGRPVTPDEWNGINAAFHRSYLELRSTCALASDAEAALAAVATSGRTQSLLSMWTHDELVKAVVETGINDHFMRIDGLRNPSDDGGTKEGHLRAHLDRVADDMGRPLEPEHVLVIGDSVDDSAAAAEVGARCVLVEGGSHDSEALATAGAPIARSLLAALKAGGVLS